MSNTLPKDIIQMIEKNNLVLAIKTLATERNISMDEAKTLIDEYEAKLKVKQNKKIEAIATKQGLKTSSKSSTSHSKASNLNTSVDAHLNDIGYKKPLLPYWAKRVLIILIVVVLLSLLFWQLVP